MSLATPILHADADAFYAAVEQRDEPALRGVPMVVGGGVVLAASYEARAFGVRGAMPGSRARALCPELVVVSPRWPAYVEAGRALMGVFERVAPVVQRLSIEEAFLDVRDVDTGDTAPEIAARLRRTVREEVGLDVSVGVARTKLLAKLASRQAKPDGLVVVPETTEMDFLRPLAVEDLWGVGPATASKLRAHGLRTVEDLGEPSLRTMISILGPAGGRYVHALAHNMETWPVRRRRGRRSVGAQRALGRRRRSASELDGVLTTLVERVAERMLKGSRTGRTVVVRLRFDDYSRATRSHTLSAPTADGALLLAAARELLHESGPIIDRRGLTLLGITVGNIDEGNGQLRLPV